jgi:hypothetical protein
MVRRHNARYDIPYELIGFNLARSTPPNRLVAKVAGAPSCRSWFCGLDIRISGTAAVVKPDAGAE